MGAGAEVELTVIRKGKERKISVILGDAGAPVLAAKEMHPALEGATFTNGQDNAGNDGVVISELEDRSPAARIGLQEDDVIIGVNRQRVNNTADLTRLIEEQEGNVIALNVKRGNASLYVVIR